MGDLTSLQAAEATKIVGSSTDGTETNPVNVSANFEILGCDRLNNGGTAISKNFTTTPQEIMVGASVLTERKCVLIQPSAKVWFGFTNSALPFILFAKQYAIFELGPSTHLWVKADSGTVAVAIGEVA